MVKIVKTDRANKIFAYFKAPISSVSMDKLYHDTSFIGRFSRVDSVKHNDELMGMRLIDDDSTNYLINVDSIEAFSTKLPESKVKEKLIMLTKGLLHRLGRQTNDFEIDDTVDHEAIEFDLREILNKSFVDKLNNIFKKKGYEEPEFTSVKLVCTKKNKHRLFQFHYPDKKDKDKKLLVVESNKDLIKDMIKVIDEIEK